MRAGHLTPRTSGDGPRKQISEAGMTLYIVFMLGCIAYEIGFLWVIGVRHG
jgi:hypothetical protein